MIGTNHHNFTKFGHLHKIDGIERTIPIQSDTRKHYQWAVWFCPMLGWQHTLLKEEKINKHITSQSNRKNRISILKQKKRVIAQRKKRSKEKKKKKNENPKLIWDWFGKENECTSAGSRVGSENDTAVVSNADDSGSHGMGSAEIDLLIHDSTAKQQREEEKSVKCWVP